MKDSSLTYSVLYTPDTKTNSQLNYVCSDKKIHVRFRDFNDEQIISGFEKKLTYLFTYLVNFSKIKELFGVCSPEIVMQALLDSSDVKQIEDDLKYKKQIDFKKFRLFVNYKRDNCIPFGKIDNKVFPMELDERGVAKDGNLDTFLKILKVDLLEYLFNDSYSIIIHRDYHQNINNKYSLLLY